MLSKQKSGKHKFLIIKLLGLSVLGIYAVYMYIQININIKNESAKLNDTQIELKTISAENEQLEHYSSGENLNEYMERIARDEMGYADPHERVYYVVN
jgi:cell division protein FtsB